MIIDDTSDLDCAICGGLMIDPRVLECQHAFCLRCLFRLVERDRGTGICIKCPFNCSQQTVTQGDIRTLCKNRLIESLCRKARSAALRGEDASNMCDWCDNTSKSESNNSFTTCEKCSSRLCNACIEHSEWSEHTFLCSTIGGKDIQKYPFFVTSNGAAEATLQQITEARIGIRPVITQCTPVFLKCEESVYKCTGKHGSATSEVFYTFLSAPTRYSPIENTLIATPPLESRDLELLFHSLEATEAVKAVLKRRLPAILDNIVPCLKLATSPTDVSEALVVFNLVSTLYCIAVDFIKPSVQRVSLLGNMLSRGVDERLYTAARQQMYSDDIKKKLIFKAKKVIQLNDDLYDELNTLQEISNELDAMLTETGKTIIAKGARMAMSQSTLTSMKPSVSVFPAEVCYQEINNISEEFMAIYSSLSRIIHENVGECTRLCGGDAKDIEKIASIEELIKRDILDTISIHCSCHHMHAIWGQMAILFGEIFEKRYILQFSSQIIWRDAPIGELHEAAKAANEVVSTLLPQIQDIRKQHLSILQGGAAVNVSHCRILQQQLGSLILRSFEIFEKQNAMVVAARRREEENTLLLSSEKLIAFYSSRRKIAMEDTTVTDSTVPVLINKIGNELTRLILELTPDNVNEYRKERMHLLVEKTRIPSYFHVAHPHTDALDNISEISHETLEIPLLPIDRKRGLHMAKRAFKADDPTAKCRDVSHFSSGTTRYKLIPIFIGTYAIPSLTGPVEYPFFSMGQTGKAFFNLPTLRGVDWVRRIAAEILSKKVVFWSVNIALILAKRALNTKYNAACPK